MAFPVPSLPWMTEPFLVMKCATKIEFVDSGALYTTVFELCNLAAMSLSVYPLPCKLAICALQTSVKEDCMNVEMIEKNHPKTLRAVDK